MSTKDCVREINKFLPGDWKRVSKTTATITKRVFSSSGHPNVVVLEDDDGKLSIFVSVEGEKKPSSPKRLNQKDYYFQHEYEDCEHRYWIVPKEFWDVNHHFDERVNQSNVKMPRGFCETMEACFDFNGDDEEAVKLLLDAGFIQLPDKKD